MQVPGFTFNANQYEPNQGFGIHPPALKVPFTITNTEMKSTKDQTGGYLAVEFTSSLGIITNNYNVKNDSPKTVEIAFGQLSALCRAINVYNLIGDNECAALRGGKGLMDIGYQKGNEPDPAFPDRKGYTELKRVYDLAGNDPSKPAQAQQANVGQVQQGNPAPSAGQPMTQQAGGGWGQPQQNQPAQQQPQSQQSQPQGQAWQPGNQPAGQAPPWGNR